MSRGDEKMAGYFKAPGVKRNITRNFEMRKGCIVFFHSFYVMFSFQLGCVGWTQWKWHVLGITGHEVLTKSDAREMRPLLEVPSWQLLDAALRVIIRRVISAVIVGNLHIGYVTMFCGK